MNRPATRSVLRVVHLLFSIPMLGYIYGPASEVQQYASAVRFLFVPMILLSGLWMYAGLLFAIIAVAIWLAAYSLFGVGTAILASVALFIARKIWLVVRRRRGTA